MIASPSKNATTIRQKLDAAWRLRIARDAYDFLIISAEINHYFALQGLPEQVEQWPENQSVQSFTTIEKLECIDYYSLQASCLRQNQESRKAQKNLQLTHEKFGSLVHASGFYLYELAYSHFDQSDFSVALKHFVMANKISTHADVKIASQLNHLLCLENSGFDLQALLEKLKQELKDQKIHPKVTELIHRQVECIDLHLLFRIGNFAAIASFRQQSAKLDQTYLYQKWLLSLPYHNHSIERIHLEHQLDASSLYGTQNYRLRTITGTSHPDDLHLMYPAYELIDRAYLWLWRWLVKPDSHSCSGVVQILNKLLPKTKSGLRDNLLLTHEDRALLKNIILWLGLFDEIDPPYLYQILEQYDLRSSQGIQLLEHEALFVQWLFALKYNKTDDARDLFAWLKNKEVLSSTKNPRKQLSNNIDLHFCSLAESLAKSLTTKHGLAPNIRHLNKLSEDLRNLCGHSLNQSAAHLRIDLFSCRITDQRSQQGLTSEPMSYAFELLNQNSSVPASVFMQHCFGISRFQAEIHANKIYNLLARMKKLASPFLRFAFKSEKIIAQGDWREVEFIRSTLKERKIDSIHLFNQTFTTVAPSQRSSEVDRITNAHEQLSKMIGNEFSRSELEPVIGLSRSGTNRMIAKFIQSGAIEKKGTGRSSKYKINHEFILQLQSSHKPKAVGILT